ncbi:MAG: hypothetical protein AUI04_16395 [Candidatus Rokubacteria bacterium 13_2_20CM_2_64_8]|nr:MAG: hypothetical protein AUI04_16395 [Candidatus Rokubacteria bacterium 13_2_20CM_2_64_8]
MALALCTLIPAAGWSQQIIEPHQPGWERWFKLDWEAGEWRGHPVVKGYLYNASPKTVGDVQLLVDALDAGGGILAQKVSWAAGSPMAPFSRRYFGADAPLVAIAPQQPASYRVSVYSYSEILEPRGRGRGF